MPALAQLIHPDALQQLRDGVRQIIANPETAAGAAERLGVADSTEYLALEPAAVYSRLVERAAARNPGYAEFLRSAQVELRGAEPEAEAGTAAIC